MLDAFLPAVTIPRQALDYLHLDILAVENLPWNKDSSDAHSKPVRTDFCATFIKIMNTERSEILECCSESCSDSDFGVVEWSHSQLHYPQTTDKTTLADCKLLPNTESFHILLSGTFQRLGSFTAQLQYIRFYNLKKIFRCLDQILFSRIKTIKLPFDLIYTLSQLIVFKNRHGAGWGHLLTSMS